MNYAERIAPYERSIINLCLNEKETEVIASGLMPDMFHDQRLGKLFTAIMKASVLGDGCNLVSIQKHVKPEESDLLVLAVECSETNGTTLNVKEFCKTVKEAFYQRRAIRNLGEIYNAAVKADPLNPYPLFEKISTIDQTVVEANALDQFHGDLLIRAMNVMERDMTDGSSKGILTGMKKIDQHLGGGLVPGRVITIGARPGGGKTTLAVNWAYNAAKNGNHPLYITVEMDSISIAEKVVSLHTCIDGSKITNRRMSSDEIDTYFAGTKELSRWKLSINSKSAASWERVVMSIRNGVRYHGVDMAVIDYIQQYRLAKRLTPREEIDAMMHQVKDLAGETGIPIIVISQLNRDIEKRSADKDPKMSDIKESGTIEQASDTLIILALDDDIDNFSREKVRKPFAHIVKNRWGGLGKIGLNADFRINKITEG